MCVCTKIFPIKNDCYGGHNSSRTSEVNLRLFLPLRIVFMSYNSILKNIIQNKISIFEKNVPEYLAEYYNISRTNGFKFLNPNRI